MDELETIIDYSRFEPAIDPVFDGRSYDYWSGSAYADHPDYAWGVTFNVGSAGWYYWTYTSYVRCVRGGP
jgi:hypothetical protein